MNTPPAVTAAFEEVRKYHPNVNKVHYEQTEDGYQTWCFYDAKGATPAFDQVVDVDVLTKALDAVYETCGFPATFHYGTKP